MKVGVLLSGCGVEDGSEIYEAVLTILALERGGASVQALAPDVEQANVVNHYTGAESRQETRSALAESARIVRGKISSINEVSAHDLDALVIPGGYGVVKNLCSYASDGVNARVNPEVERVIQEIHGLGKPIGAMCVGPLLVALSLRNVAKPNGPLTMTIGDNGSAALDLVALGVSHAVTGVDQIYVDSNNKIVSTAAFLLAHSVSEAEAGITKLANQVLQMAGELGPGHVGETMTSTVTSA